MHYRLVSFKKKLKHDSEIFQLNASPGNTSKQLGSTYRFLSVDLAKEFLWQFRFDFLLYGYDPFKTLKSIFSKNELVAIQKYWDKIIQE